MFAMFPFYRNFYRTASVTLKCQKPRTNPRRVSPRHRTSMPWAATTSGVVPSQPLMTLGQGDLERTGIQLRTKSMEGATLGFWTKARFSVILNSNLGIPMDISTNGDKNLTALSLQQKRKECTPLFLGPKLDGQWCVFFISSKGWPPLISMEDDLLGFPEKIIWQEFPWFITHDGSVCMPWSWFAMATINKNPIHVVASIYH